jgi:hypothetical protein
MPLGGTKTFGKLLSPFGKNQLFLGKYEIPSTVQSLISWTKRLGNLPMLKRHLKNKILNLLAN